MHARRFSRHVLRRLRVYLNHSQNNISIIRTRLRLATLTDELSHVVHLPVLGVMTTFASNSDKVIDAVFSLYGSWSTLDETLVSPSSAVVKVLVRDDDLIPSVTTPRYHVLDPARMTVESPE